MSGENGDRSREWNEASAGQTVFITVRPDGFLVGAVHHPILRFKLARESNARKLWIGQGGQRTLECFSSNGSISRHGKACASCSDSANCRIKLRLHFTLGNLNCCLELPHTSMENFLRFRDETRLAGTDIRNTLIAASVVDRGYWREIVFSLDRSG